MATPNPSTVKVMHDSNVRDRINAVHAAKQAKREARVSNPLSASVGSFVSEDQRNLLDALIR